MFTPSQIKEKKEIFSHTDTKMVLMFKVLSDVNRYRIFRILAEESQYSVKDLSKILGISLSLASQHLNVMSRAGLLLKERAGKTIHSRLKHNNPFVQAIVQTIQFTMSSTNKMQSDQLLSH